MLLSLFPAQPLQVFSCTLLGIFAGLSTGKSLVELQAVAGHGSPHTSTEGTPWEEHNKLGLKFGLNLLPSQPCGGSQRQQGRVFVPSLSCLCRTGALCPSNVGWPFPSLPPCQAHLLSLGLCVPWLGRESPGRSGAGGMPMSTR